MSHAFNDDEIANLTDDDIQNILWPIILRARENPDAQFGPGLFAAYDSYVEDNRLPEADSQKYFRFLVRMVAGRTASESLAGRFKRLLAEHNISVDFDSEILSPEERTLENAQPDEAADERSSSTEEDSTGQRNRSRRVSISSTRDRDVWKTGERLDRGADTARTRKGTRSSSRASDPTGNRARRSTSRRRLLEQRPVRGRVNGRSISDHAYDHRRARSASPSSQGSPIIDRNDELQHHMSKGHIPQTPFDGNAAIRRFLDDTDHNTSETQLLADADTMMHHSALRLLRNTLQRWHEQMVATTRTREAQLFRTRAIVDINLKQETFRIWNDKYRERRLQRDLDRFWAVQGDQAQAKWEMHLMEKAFLHWATTTKEQVERTAVARRHVLRNKYFNAWREFTAVNELKVQRFRKRRFFERWRRLLHTTLDHEDMAVAVYEQTLMRRTFQQCLWHYRDNVAGYWAEDKLRKQYFYRWRDIVRQIRQRENMMLQIHRHDEQRRVLHAWRARLIALRDQESSAISFYRQKALKSAVESFGLHAKLSPLFRQVAEKRNGRVARSVLQLWAVRASQSQQATRIDNMRVLRNTLTNWDDQLRCAWLQHRIDDRLVIETLYKLSIASKASMHTRLRDYKLLSQCLGQWKSVSEQRSADLKQAYVRFQQRKRQINLRYAWNRLRSRFLFYRDDEEAASSHYYFSTVPTIFQQWRDSAQAIRRLDQQAEAARYYFLVTDSMERWRNAMHESQRLRRREAYSAVRRTCKTNLARRSLGLWRARTATVKEMDQVAEERAEDRTLAALTTTFRTWHDRTDVILRSSQQAMSSRRVRLQSTSIAKLRLHHERCEQLDSRVVPFKTELAALSAQKAFSRLGWRLFELRRRGNDAAALREKHWQSHVRSMLRYWAVRAESARSRQAVASETLGIASGETSGEGEDLLRGGDDRDRGDQQYLPSDQSMARAEEWTALDESALGFSRFNLDLGLIPEAGTEELEGVISSTPLPGYLRTPSRRSTARSMARNRLVGVGANSTTIGTPTRNPASSNRFGRPATAPPAAWGREVQEQASTGITPFEQRLRDQGFGSSGSYSRAPSSSRRSTGGTDLLQRATNRKPLAFDDIPEDDVDEHGLEE